MKDEIILRAKNKNINRNERKETRFLWKFVILSNGVYEETGFLGSSCVSLAKI
jgi:hypothetical protein